MEKLNPEIIRGKNLDACYAAITRDFQGLIQGSIERKGYATIALSGGRTPAGLFEAIAHSPTIIDFPWHKVFIFFVDERVVSPDHLESNYSLFRTHFMAYLPLVESQVFRMPVEIKPLSVAASHYQQTMVEVFSSLTKREKPYSDDQFPVFDLILLGMGQDGHTASLFPGHSALSQRKWVAAVEADQAVPPVPRLTLTFPVINHADTVIFLINGEEKVRLAESFLSNISQENYPASLVNPKRRLLWYLAQ
ncbi:MAG: 6-phosphogluconolactonase [Proteobacteria bacterium]|nr:6-phosphogluconolactonase [Desulfobulbaceae bacterium]MBU4151725.1 6-phosphogluconolactonase [Pseudomonadota bacterium]